MAIQSKSALPTHDLRAFPSENACLYCGASNELTDEHIIPYGLGGRWVIPNGSCQACARTTSAFERVVQRTMLGPLRMRLEVRTRRKGKRPDKLPLKVRLTATDDWTYVEVERELYPFLITLPILTLPDEISGVRRDGSGRAAAKQFWLRAPLMGAEFSEYCQDLASSLGVAEIMPEGKADCEAFFRLLAKIAHGYALAEIGPRRIDPFLVPLILGGDPGNATQFVGGIDRIEPGAEALHQVWIVQSQDHQQLVSVRIRLFACLGTPTYVVAVGRRAVR